MSKRYMDFVPASSARAMKPVVGKSTKREASSSVRAGLGYASSGRSVAKKATGNAAIEARDRKEATRIREAKSVEEFTWYDAKEGKSVITKEPVFGVIEDLHPKETDDKVGKDSAKKGTDSAKKETERKKTYGTTRKSPFVNTEKITKRPLSKSVYQKKVVVPKEEPSKTVTIITKPEKDSKVGIIVAIILTIILGAAAGTVAFLLLPK